MSSVAPAPTGQAARWAGQRERRRAEFVAAALETITEHGPGATVEQIAARAGVARTRIYRHFTDRADLEHAISARVADLIVAELDPLWHPEGSTHQMISAVIGAHARWLAANRHLYGYLVAHEGSPADPDGLDGYSGVRQAVAEHLTGLFGGYLGLVGVDDAVAESLAYGVLGLVESVTNRWLERPGVLDSAASDSSEGGTSERDKRADSAASYSSEGGTSERDKRADSAAVAEQLSAWVWAMLDSTLRAAGVDWDPDAPLPRL